MSNAKVNIEHDGTIYNARAVTIKSTSLSKDLFGIRCDGWSMGASTLGVHRDAPFQLMDAVGVANWERLPGTTMYLLSGLGDPHSTVVGVAGVVGGNSFIFNSTETNEKSN